MRSRTKIVTPPAMPVPPPKSAAVFGGSGGLSVAAFLESAKIPRSKHSKLSDLEIALRNARERARTGEWSGANGPILVGLYALLHEKVYGILPTELEEKQEFKRAAGNARRLLDSSFNGDGDAFVEFAKWVWKREEGRIKWSKSVNRERNRFAWRFAYCASAVTDYRVEMSGRRR